MTKACALMVSRVHSFVVAFAWMTIPNAAVRSFKPRSNRHKPRSDEKPFNPKSRNELQGAIDACMKMSLSETTLAAVKTPNANEEVFALDGITI